MALSKHDAARLVQTNKDAVEILLDLAKQIEAGTAPQDLKAWARDARAFAQGSQWIMDLPSMSA